MKVRNKGGVGGVNFNLGCMFFCDKVGFIKGEREIIEGIYWNCGDVLKEVDSVKLYSFKDEWDFVWSYKDVWMIGK